MEWDKWIVPGAIALVQIAVVWGTIRQEVKHLARWQERHDEKDDAQFKTIHQRIDQLWQESR